MNDYRDVTPKNPQGSSQSIKDISSYILDYLKHPINKIKNLPDWPWSTLILAMVGFTMITGLLSGLVPPSFFRALGGLLVSPIVSLIMSVLGSLFVYYYFQVFEKRTVSFRKIFTLIFFANIPFFLFQIGSEYLPPISLVGFAFTAMLLAVGLNENFSMEKRRAIRLAIILFAVVFLIWLWNRIDVAHMDKL
jgi:hypothetical protein